MGRLNLDLVPDDLRRLLLSLISRDGAVLESGGKPVAKLVGLEPGQQAALLDSTDDWNDGLNQRRVELIRRKHSVGLSAAEDAELEKLKIMLRRHVNRVAPRPLEQFRAIRDELLAKTESKIAAPQ